jgi:tetratricopeptide (TPR) repeat protein
MERVRAVRAPQANDWSSSSCLQHGAVRPRHTDGVPMRRLLGSGAWKPLVWLVLVIVATTAWTGCNGPQGGTSPCPCESAELPPPVDTTLMAYLSKARAIHHEADLLEQDDRWADAVARLESLIATPSPGGGTLPEVQEVLADTFARVAELRGRLDQFDEAEKAVHEGLERAPAGSYFEGHLYEVRGVTEQRRAAALAEKGDTTAARTAREAAMKAFERAVEIQDHVVDRALGGDGGAGAK